MNKQTHFHKDTPAEVREVLERARKERIRVRIYLGDQITGRDWCEENDVYGYIGRSTGTQKIPLLVHNSRSLGGPGLLDHCIVRIATARGKVDLYRHPKYHQPEFTVKPISDVFTTCPAWWPGEFPGEFTHAVLRDGEEYANFKGEKQVARFVKHLS